MSNPDSPAYSASDDVSTDGQAAPRAAMYAQQRNVPPPPGWHAQQQRPRIEADEVGPNGSDKVKKAIVLKIEGVTKRRRSCSSTAPQRCSR